MRGQGCGGGGSSRVAGRREAETVRQKESGKAEEHKKQGVLFVVVSAEQGATRAFVSALTAPSRHVQPTGWLS